MQKRFSRKWKSLALLLVLALLTGSAWAQGLTVKGKVNGSTGEANDDIMPPMTGIRGRGRPPQRLERGRALPGRVQHLGRPRLPQAGER